jgi:hypothetical protein
MHRSVRFALLSAALLVATVACGSSSSTPTTPTTPVNPVTETFPGSIGPNGAATFPFTISRAGTVTATLTTVGPDSTTLIGFSIGTWSGTTCSVGTGLFQDKAVQGSTIVANVSAPGTLCLRVYDGGTITDTTTFSVDVSHP